MGLPRPAAFQLRNRKIARSQLRHAATRKGDERAMHRSITVPDAIRPAPPPGGIGVRTTGAGRLAVNSLKALCNPALCSSLRTCGICDAKRPDGRRLVDESSTGHRAGHLDDSTSHPLVRLKMDEDSNVSLVPHRRRRMVGARQSCLRSKTTGGHDVLRHIFEFDHNIGEGAVGPTAATLSKWGAHHAPYVASKKRKVQTSRSSELRSGLTAVVFE